MRIETLAAWLERKNPLELRRWGGKNVEGDYVTITQAGARGDAAHWDSEGYRRHVARMFVQGEVSVSMPEAVARELYRKLGEILDPAAEGPATTPEPVAETVG